MDAEHKEVDRQPEGDEVYEPPQVEDLTAQDGPAVTAAGESLPPK